MERARQPGAPLLADMPSVVRWQILLRSLRDGAGGVEPPDVARSFLVRFKATGERPAYGFLPCGLDHEHAAWPESWGPRLPTEVDWAGFRGSPRERCRDRR